MTRMRPAPAGMSLFTAGGERKYLTAEERSRFLSGPLGLLPVFKREIPRITA